MSSSLENDYEIWEIGIYWTDAYANQYTFIRPYVGYDLTMTAIDLTTGLTLAAAVPEPETYAMILAGLGVIGAVARRRKVNVN